MKIRTHILATSIALIVSAAFSAEDAKTNETSVSVVNSSNKATASASGKTGKATVIIDVNGKREIREIEIGNGTEINVITSDAEGAPSGGASATLTLEKPKTTTWLGVAPEEISEELRAQLPLEPGAGLVVRTVLPDSPAAKYGLQKNDVLLKLDDQLLTNPSQLRTLVASKKEGDSVKITYFRRGQQATLDITLAKHEEDVLGYRLPALKNLERLVHSRSRAVVVDKDGKIVGGSAPDANATIEKLDKTLRDFGADDKTIDETKRVLTETMKAVRDTLSDVNVAKTEVQKGAGEIAKALDEVRAAVEKVRKQAEEAVQRERENRRAENPGLEKEKLR